MPVRCRPSSAQRHHAVALQVRRIVLDGQHAAAGALVGVDQLARERRLADVQVIGEHDHERIVPGERLGQQDRLPRAQHPLLAQEEEPARRHGDGPLLGRRALGLEHLLQLHLAIDVVLQRALAARRDEQDVLDPRLAQLSQYEVDGRPVDHRKHLLGHRLRSRQEPAAVPGSDNDRFHAALNIISSRSTAPPLRWGRTTGVPTPGAG